jgi:hypothetical protein
LSIYASRALETEWTIPGVHIIISGTDMDKSYALCNYDTELYLGTSSIVMEFLFTRCGATFDRSPDTLPFFGRPAGACLDLCVVTQHLDGSSLRKVTSNLHVPRTSDSSNSLVALTTDLGATFWATSKLHRHTALTNSKLLKLA